MKNAAVLLMLSLSAVAWAEAQPSPQKPEKALCEPAPGSRIARAPNAQGECDIQTPLARSYSKEDLESTGRVDAYEALRALDPSLMSRSGL